MSAYKLSRLLALAGLVVVLPAQAGDVQASKAWVRPTAPAQQVAGAFMELKSGRDMELVGGSSPAAETVELHFMRMENGMMEMRPLRKIELPKGKTVSFAMSGLHVMLIGLKWQLKEGDKVPLRLLLQDKTGARQNLDVILDAHDPNR